MNLLAITWPMIAAACAMLGLTQAFLWWHSRNQVVYPISMVMAFSAVAVALLEMQLSSSPDAAQHDSLLMWLNLAIALVLVPMVWAIQAYIPTARRWLAMLITVLWIVGIAVNFLLPGNLTFSEVVSVDRHLTTWGEEYFVSQGEVNDWKWLVDMTVFLIPIYALDAAWRYLLASIVASLAYLLGVAFLYHTNGALDLAVLAAAARSNGSPAAALGLMTAGLAVKGALFPVHFWLPRAHSEAPSPVSGLLSGLVVKAPFFVLLRLWLGPFADVPELADTLLGLLGAAAIAWGSLQALRQERLKLLVAYSTVAQIGYLFLFFPLSHEGNTLAAVTIFIVGHALAKAAMFLAAGNIIACLGHDRIPVLDRVAERLPLSLAAFGIAGICIIGLPPSGNFVAKWLLIDAAVRTGEWGWVVIIVAGSLLAAAYVFRVLGHAFTPEHGFEGGTPITRTMSWVPFLVALLALLLGLIAAPIFEFVELPGAAAVVTESVP